MHTVRAAEATKHHLSQAAWVHKVPETTELWVGRAWPETRAGLSSTKRKPSSAPGPCSMLTTRQLPWRNLNYLQPCQELMTSKYLARALSCKIHDFGQTQTQTVRYLHCAAGVDTSSQGTSRQETIKSRHTREIIDSLMPTRPLEPRQLVSSRRVRKLHGHICAVARKCGSTYLSISSTLKALHWLSMNGLRMNSFSCEVVGCGRECFPVEC